MEWTLDKNRPISPQLCEKLAVMISVGECKPNERLMSVREVALSAGVNPNTVQKSYEELERKGLIYSVRGSGWFVNSDITVANDLVNDLIKEKTKVFFEDMVKLGLDPGKIKKYVEEW